LNRALAVAADPTHVVLVGNFGTPGTGTTATTSPPGTTLTLGGKTLTATAGLDMYVASFAP
jgi:hypothetical protein